MSFEHRITVFTPTYNRAYIIENLFNSLKRQTFTHFEWLVVDDGSVDETEQLFRTWQSEQLPFSIRYYKTGNGGKHRAINWGLDLANGEIFFVVDSDDRLTEDALKKIDAWFSEIENQPNISGVAANKGISPTKTTNKPFSAEYLDKTLLDMYDYRENGELVLFGEKALAFYTDFHRQYKFPAFDGEKFMTEAVVYNRMAHDGYKMRFYNDIIWVYEYQPDGLTRAGNSIFLRNPKGYGLFLREKAQFQNSTRIGRLKLWYTFTCDLSHLYPSRDIASAIDAPHPLIALIYVVHKLIAQIQRLFKS